MSSASSEEGCPFVVDLNRKRTISLSSVDSEPIPPRPRYENGSRSPSVGSATSDADPTLNKKKGSLLSSIDYTLPETFDTEPVEVEKLSEATVATVLSVADACCVAEMAEHSIPLDAQTSLYTSDGRYFGVILALIGPVQEPYYVVYTKKTADGNVEQEDKEEKDEAVVGTELYYRVSSTVSILFAPQALCEAGGGTDASYINDEELPEHVRPDFSDDEKEKQWKRRNKAARPGGESVSSEESLEDIEWSHIRLEEEGTAVPGVAVPSWVADSKK